MATLAAQNRPLPISLSNSAFGKDISVYHLRLPFDATYLPAMPPGALIQGTITAHHLCAQPPATRYGKMQPDIGHETDTCQKLLLLADLAGAWRIDAGGYFCLQRRNFFAFCIIAAGKRD
ncbi:MAG: hypothetical protein OXC81_04725 [Betaproteobacteria bacterium]|nr:hypothetical protein [Betaproteobacteria bacterium]